MSSGSLFTFSSSETSARWRCLPLPGRGIWLSIHRTQVIQWLSRNRQLVVDVESRGIIALCLIETCSCVRLFCSRVFKSSSTRKSDDLCYNIQPMMQMTTDDVKWRQTQCCTHGRATCDMPIGPSAPLLLLLACVALSTGEWIYWSTTSYVDNVRHSWATTNNTHSLPHRLDSPAYSLHSTHSSLCVC